METLKKILDDSLKFFYTSNLSLFDFFAISALNGLIIEYSAWFCLGYIPFIWYTIKQKNKYDILNGK